jgi:ATP-dependent Zn protease
LLFEEVSSGAGGGEESDLAMATHLLTDAEMRLGLGDTLTWQSPDITARLLAQQSRTRVEDALRTAEAETRAALTRHHAALERIAEALLDKRELHAEDLANLLDQVIPDRTTESADRVDADELTPQTSGA